MDIKSLKSEIESKSLTDSVFIFVVENNSEYIAFQYVYAIADILRLTVRIVDNLTEQCLDPWSANKYFDVIVTDTLSEFKPLESILRPCAVICSKVSTNIKKTHSKAIVELKNPTPMNIMEFIKVYCPGLSDSIRDSLLKDNDNNVYKIVSDLDKLKIYPENEREFRYNEFKDCGLIYCESDKQIFSLVDAILSKNVEKALDTYVKIKNGNCDLNPFALITLLYNKLKDIIKIQLGNININNAWMYRTNGFINVYTREELISIFLLITSMDKKIKSGEIPADMAADYMLVKILGV